MSFSRIEVTVNPTMKSWIKAADDQVFLTGDNRPTLYSRETNVLCLSFVDNAGAVYPLEADDEFELAIDSTRRNVTDTNDLMAYSDNTQVDIAGDWSDISRANGKISIRVTCDRALFESRLTDLGDDDMQDGYLQIMLMPNGETNATTMVQDIVNTGGNVIGQYQE
jgi:hypothetical protein